MKFSVTFVDLTVYQNITPLVFGYLQTYACKDSEIRKSFNFEIYSQNTQTAPEKVLNDLISKDSKVYAFSCYVWNIGFVSYLLEALLEVKPNSFFILGGPQVINQGEIYLNPKYKNTIICNGDGEKPFANFLKQLLNESPDFTAIPGISFIKEDNLIVNESEEVIINLDEIPSPFLEGIFSTENYTYSILETNRGCPFNCAFCFYGGLGKQIRKFSYDRIKKDIDWIAENLILGVYIADANWGIFERDLDFSMMFADNKKKNNCPMLVITSNTKSNPKRLYSISKIFLDAELRSAHSISFQTLNPAALEIVNRKNMEIENLFSLQELLNRDRVSSYIELIWPIPGETLLSFIEGIDKLCKTRVECIFIYPLILLRNTELFDKQNILGIKTRLADSRVAEVNIVYATKEVSPLDYNEGLWICFATHLLYNTKGLLLVGHYLSENNILSFGSILESFVKFCQKNITNSTIIEVHKEFIANFSYWASGESWGYLIHLILHSHRDEFDNILLQFCEINNWWNDEQIPVLFELDLLNRPFVYNTTSLVKNYKFRHIKSFEVLDDGYFIELTDKLHPFIKEFFEVDKNFENTGNEIKINHMRDQLPFMPIKTNRENGDYCHALLINIRSILPVWVKTNVEYI